MHLYPVIDNPLDVLLPGSCRNAHRVVLAKTHAPSSYRHLNHVRIQIVQPVGRGLSTVERLPVAHDILHLVRPGKRYFHSQRLRPTRRNITVGYNPLRQCEPWQPGPHKLRPARLTLIPVERGDHLKCTRNRIGLLRLYPTDPHRLCLIYGPRLGRARDDNGLHLRSSLNSGLTRSRSLGGGNVRLTAGTQLPLPPTGGVTV